MKKIVSWRRLGCWLLTLLILLSFCCTAFAAGVDEEYIPSWGYSGNVDDGGNSIVFGDFTKLDTVKETSLDLYFLDEHGRGLDGVVFSIYQVTDAPAISMDRTSGFVWKSWATSAFESSSSVLGVPDLNSTTIGYDDLHTYANCLAEAVESNGIYEDFSGMTYNGKLALVDLPVGLYLIVGDSDGVTGPNGGTYVPEPFIVSVPGWDTSTNAWSYNVAARVKYSNGTGSIQFIKAIGLSESSFAVTLLGKENSGKTSFRYGEQGVLKVTVASNSLENDSLFNVYAAPGIVSMDDVIDASASAGTVFYSDAACTQEVSMPIRLESMRSMELYVPFVIDGTFGSYAQYTMYIESILDSKIMSYNIASLGPVSTMSGYGLRDDGIASVSVDEEEFLFNVRLTFNGMGINGTYAYDGSKSGTITFVDGNAQVSLGGNRIITIYGVPSGCEYSFSEVPSSAPGYTPDETGASGVTGNGNTSQAIIVNNPVATARVRVHKSVPELVAGAVEEFTFNFNVDLTGATASPSAGSYRYHVYDDVWVDGYGNTENDHWVSSDFLSNQSTFTLTRGQYVIITGVPFGAKVTITEDESGYAPEVYLVDEYLGDAVTELVISKDMVNEVTSNIELNFQNMRPDGPALPSTGGEGVSLVLAVGMAFLAGGFVLTYFWRRKFQ